MFSFFNFSKTPGTDSFEKLIMSDCQSRWFRFSLFHFLLKTLFFIFFSKYFNRFWTFLGKYNESQIRAWLRASADWLRRGDESSKPWDLASVMTFAWLHSFTGFAKREIDFNLGSNRKILSGGHLACYQKSAQIDP